MANIIAANSDGGSAEFLTSYSNVGLVLNTDLTAGSAIGVWLKLSLSAGEAAIKSTYTIELDGGTI